jgi:hypothetical protein
MNSPTAMKILVTVVDEFIGFHLNEVPIRAFYDVLAFVFINLFNFWSWLSCCNENMKGNFYVFQMGTFKAVRERS